MEYKVALHTDIGIKKETNQDSCCIKIAETDKGKILFAVVCDGMGGLAKGEVASATLITVLSNWFEKRLPTILATSNVMEEIQYSWDRIFKEQNSSIGAYGKEQQLQLGTTVTSMIVLENGEYLIGHVGDTRAYRITNDEIEMLTEDQTVIAREIKRGRLTPEEAEHDPRKNVLLQCVGASKIVEPAFYRGVVKENENYLLCSDGFRHGISEEEIRNGLSPNNNEKEEIMKEHIVQLIETVKSRMENDNITALLIKTV